MDSKLETSYLSHVHERAPVYEDNYRLRSTRLNIEEFLKSAVWADMVDVLDSWRERTRSKLEGCETVEEMCRLQGEAHAYVGMLRLPELMLETLVGYEKEQTNARGQSRFARTTV
jgi:hypothetical protein